MTRDTLERLALEFEKSAEAAAIGQQIYAGYDRSVSLYNMERIIWLKAAARLRAAAKEAKE